MKLVIVESPAKARTINHYLGKDYDVIASVGHVRDLPSEKGSVDPDNEFAMHYKIRDGAQKNVDKIISHAKRSDTIYLASDPDREGEAIAWHIAEILIAKNVVALDKIRRVVFNEITKQTIEAAISNPRSVDINLVNAQQSRLALDYLVGFELSPVLWRKLPGSKSAGRVQSVALRMVAEREIEIKSFIPREYWSVMSLLLLSDSNTFSVDIVQYNDKKLSNTFPKCKEEADKIVDSLNDAGVLLVQKINSKEVKQNPMPPFTTSSLQQEASKKLGMSSKYTMQLAQKLYEGVEVNGETHGLITYMRTDGTSLGKDAVNSIRGYIKDVIGEAYIPSSHRIYKTKIRNAQEAHEAIRPTNIKLTPETFKQHADRDMARLYELIWLRAVACQMTSAVRRVESIALATKDGNIVGRISGSRIKFDGFLRIYNNSNNIEKSGDDCDANDENIVPKLKEGEEYKILKSSNKQHFTSPPPRFTEATLIKNLEEFGIGRPSTYANIITVLQDRGYVKLDKRQFIAENRGIIVNAFLKKFFTKYVEYDFTAKLEDELDAISSGDMDKISFLRKFWCDFHKNVNDVFELSKDVITLAISQEVGCHFFNRDENGNVNAICPDCKDGSMTINVGKYGPFISCTNYPKCEHIEKIVTNNTQNRGESNVSAIVNKDGDTLIVKDGKYGTYIEVCSKDGVVKNVRTPKGIDLSIEDNVIKYALLPIEIGNHPDTGDAILVNIGRYGPYAYYREKYYNIKGKDVFTVTLEQVISLIDNYAVNENNAKLKSASNIFKHPKDGDDIKVGKSRYGVYVLYKKKYHNINNVSEISDVTIEAAMNAINSKMK